MLEWEPWQSSRNESTHTYSMYVRLSTDIDEESDRAMPAMNESKAAQAKETRHRLEQVARKLFAQRGFAEVSAEEIVASADVTRGALYHHYDGKEGLFEAVVDTLMREVHAKLAKAAAGAGDPLQAIERGIGAFLKVCSEPIAKRILLVDGPAVLGWPQWGGSE